jgi:hypothetical protein
MYMTLSGRNAFFRTGIALSLLCVLLISIVSIVVIPVYPSMEGEVSRRPADIVEIVISRYLGPNLYAVHVSIAAAVLYGFIALLLVFHFFEQTQAPEILYVAFFVFSFNAEAARFILPLQRLYGIPSLYLLIVSRILLFGRYFGIFSLFAASVYASGLEVQKQRNILLIILVATLIIALGVPIDTQTWDSTLNMINGYTSLFRLIGTVIFLATIIGFFIAAYSRGSKDYAFTGLGAFLALAGRYLLLSADTWLSPAPGVLLLSLGTWFICTRLHKIYLWL